MMKMKKPIEEVGNYLFYRRNYSIRISDGRGAHYWYMCRSRGEFYAIYEFCQVKKEIEDDRGNYISY